MEGIRRGTTPSIPLIVDEDISDLNIRAAWKQGSLLIVKEGDALDVEVVDGKTHVTCYFSQEETLSLKSGRDIEVQIRAANASGDYAIATNAEKIPVGRVLQEGVLSG